MSNWPRCRWEKFLFSKTISELENRGGKIIVEVGSIRDSSPVAKRTDGWATLEWVKTFCRVYTVDIDPEAIEVTKSLVSFYGCNADISYHNVDALNFLKEYSSLDIDLLYLDGPDADKDGAVLALQMFIKSDLKDRALLLIDDCDMCYRWKGRGKGELVLPEALRRGFSILEDNGRQVLLGL